MNMFVEYEFFKIMQRNLRGLHREIGPIADGFEQVRNAFKQPRPPVAGQVKETHMEAEVLTKVKEIAQHKADTEERVTRRCEIGTCCSHQGDVYITRVKDDHARSKLVAKLKAGDGFQIALGTGNGARHVVECVEGEVEIYEGKKLPPGFNKFPEDADTAQLIGYFMLSKGVFREKHPEHAHHVVHQEGGFQVSYQYDARTHRRVQD